ncbi:MAG: sodium:proton antiporter [Candidatus Cloacimonadaceae bacterium]|nr:sodium:proton antiporter [Candidatus Cloacimonadaceae bacterium]MDP3113432.1 sodium:proton antiporter [Candidatus Cloacimonadaceae bacterium]
MILFLLCFILFIIGMSGVILQRNMIKIIIGLAIMEYSVILFLILIGYIDGGTVPIISESFEKGPFVDPLPQALVLTAIVIGLATKALLLSVAIRLYKHYGTFDIRKMNNLKG